MSKSVHTEPRPAIALENEIEVTTRGVEQTRRLGSLLAQLLRPGDVILLQGELGAGKTSLVQGIARELGVTGRVTSPTFTLANEYTGRLPLYHLDLYRIDRPEEVFTFGFDEYFSGRGAVVIEWAERAAKYTPSDALLVRIIDAGGNRRVFRFAAGGRRSAELLREFRQAGQAEARGERT